MVDGAISDAPLDVAAVLESVLDPGAGGVATFVGTVRSSAAAEGARGKQVVALEYEAHPEMAPVRMREIATGVAERYGLIAVTAHHRTGHCDLGEPTVVVACSAAHRAAALEACRDANDTNKQAVPIWKKEVYSDGSAWVGQGG